MADVKALLAAYDVQMRSPESAHGCPILERLGFVAITSTTPYVWTPR